MTITKYKVRTSYPKAEISPVEIERETNGYVFIRSKSGALNIDEKETKWERYFDTWDEAHTWLVKNAEQSFDYAKQRLAEKEQHLQAVRGMK